MIPRELLAALRTIEIHTARFANESLSGSYTSSFKGQGLAFREVRPYQPGDDVRTIDWNVSARMNETFVKVFVEEREMTVNLVVDLSPSERFGTRRAPKSRVASEIAALLAFSAIRNNWARAADEEQPAAAAEGDAHSELSTCQRRPL